MPDSAGHQGTDNRTQAVCNYANFDTSNTARKPCANCPQGKGHLAFNRQRCPYEHSWVEEKLAAGNPITIPKSLPSSSKGKRPEVSTLAIDSKERENDPSLHSSKEHEKSIKPPAQEMDSMSLVKSKEPFKHSRVSSPSIDGRKSVSFGNCAPDVGSSFVSGVDRNSIEFYLKHKPLQPFEELQGTENCCISGMIMDNSMGISVEPTARPLNTTPMDIENDCPVSSLRITVAGFEIDIQKNRVRPRQVRIYNKLDPRETELMTTEIITGEAGQ